MYYILKRLCISTGYTWFISIMYTYTQNIYYIPTPLCFTHPGRTVRLMPQVRRFVCCARAVYHGVSLSCLQHKCRQACRRHGNMCLWGSEPLTEGKALVNMPRSSQQTQTDILVYLSHQERPCRYQSKYSWVDILTVPGHATKSLSEPAACFWTRPNLSRI